MCASESAISRNSATDVAVEAVVLITLEVPLANPLGALARVWSCVDRAAWGSSSIRTAAVCVVPEDRLQPCSGIVAESRIEDAAADPSMAAQGRVDNLGHA